MCTTIKYKNCMGRNFDYEISYNETIKLWDKEKYKICGVATGLVEDYPLYYDAMNEFGLCMSGLNFEGNAYYYNENDNIEDVDKFIPSWNFIVEILGNCKNVNDVRLYLDNVGISDKKFNDGLPSSELHWFVCDKNCSIVIEQTKIDGFKIYEDCFDILTNNPDFRKMRKIILKSNGILNKTNNILKKLLDKKYHTRGTETYGLIGDLTSIGRFERINYYKDRLNNTNDKFNNVGQTFNLLDSVKQLYGATPVDDKFEYTIYEVVYDMEDLKIYFKKYDEMEYKMVDFGNHKDIKELVL